AHSWIDARFQEYVANYTPEQRQRALTTFVVWLVRPTTLAVLAGTVGLAFGARFMRRHLAQRAARPPEVPEPTRWFGELVALLSAHGISPAPGDTALEFATSAAAALAARPGCADVAEVPLAWAGAYYQSRFG